MRNVRKYIILVILCLMVNSIFAETKVAKNIVVIGRNIENVADEPVAFLLEQAGYNVIICKQSDLSSLKLYLFDAAVISENADADNTNVLDLIRGGQIPLLNMKGFTYAAGRLNWGEPNSGVLDELSYTYDLYIEHPEHPIFKGLEIVDKKISLSDDLEKECIMPIKVELPGTYCLATAYTQGVGDFDEVGEPQTSIHEIPAEMRGGAKYICLPMKMASAFRLNEAGQQLIRNIVNYLLSDESFEMELPFLEISAFSVEGMNATINQAENTIELAMDAEEFTAMDSLRAASVAITLADPVYSHVHPLDGTLDLHLSPYVPKTFVVTDYISRRAYDFSIRLWHKEGIEETEAERMPRKELRNGQILIIRGENQYTILGNKIQ